MELETEPNVINQMVYDFLLERGYNHSAFVFKTETKIEKSDSKIYNHLLTLISKGKLYEEMEEDFEKSTIQNADQLSEKKTENLNDFIDEKIEKQLSLISEKNLAIKKMDFELEDKYSGLYNFKYQTYGNFIFGIDKPNGFVFILNFMENKKDNNKIRKLNDLFTKFGCKVIFNRFIVFYDKKSIFFLDKENFNIKKVFGIKDNNEFENLLFFENYIIFLFSKHTLILNNNFSQELLIKENFTNVKKTKNSLFLHSQEQNRIQKYCLKTKKIFDLKIPENFIVISISSNSNFEILTVFMKGGLNNKNYIFIYKENLGEFIFYLQIKNFLNNSKIFKNKSFLLYNETNIIIFDLINLNFIYKKKYKNEIILNIDWKTEREFIIEFLGNKFHKINIKDDSYIEFERTSKGYYMILNSDKDCIIEIQNIENYHLIKV